MKTSDLYKDKNDCCGCELCAQSCPRGIIKMGEDEQGFLYPIIEDDSTCINCKKCLKVCPMKTPGRPGNQITKTYSFSLSETEDLKRSASGGMATALSRLFIGKGGVVYGVRYDETFYRIVFSRAESLGDLEAFRGSKYAQATKKDIYAGIKEDLKNNREVLFIGLPCETAAVYHAFGEHENLYTASLICHGPTSQKVHRDYIKNLPHSEASRLNSLSVRYKKTGWKPYYIHAEYNDGNSFDEVFSSSDYGIAFLYLKRPSCRTCRYKYGDKEFGLQADLTIGDFHGVDKKSKQYNPWGVSQGSVHTEKGEYLISLLEGEYELSTIPFDTIKVTNRGMFVAIPQRGNLDVFMRDYLQHGLHYACHSKMVERTNKKMRLYAKMKKIRAIKKIPAKIGTLLNRLFR